MSDLFHKAFNYNESRMAKKMGYYPYFIPATSKIGPRTTIQGKERIMLGSNNYMGLTNHPDVIQASQKAIEAYGTGCTGSRFLNGTLDLHTELEERLAKFTGKDRSIVFSTGYQTNLGVISSITGKSDIIFSDSLNHASIVDACRLSRAEVVKFDHNDPQDLEQKLRKVPKDCGKMIVADGVFSMEGDIINLPHIVDLADEYEARIMIDDAHGVGYLGEKGEGTPGHFGLMDEVDLMMGTFSKSFASIGGFVAAEDDVIEYIYHHARSLIFSASLPPSSVAAVLAALDIIENSADLRKKVMDNGKRLRKGLQAIGYETGGETPIVPVIIGDEMRMFATWRALFDAGVYTNPVRAPATPPGKELLRTSVMATHTKEDIDEAIAIFEAVGNKMGLI